MQLPPQLRPRPNDVTFTLIRDAGDSGCLCSRCLGLIGDGDCPIVYRLENGSSHFRYHPKCLGIIVDDYEEDWGENYQDLPY